MTHVSCSRFTDVIELPTTRLIRAVSSSHLDRCDGLVVDTTTRHDVSLCSPCSVSPTFSIADILTPPFQSHRIPRLDLSAVTATTSPENIVSHRPNDYGDIYFPNYKVPNPFKLDDLPPRPSSHTSQIEGTNLTQSKQVDDSCLFTKCERSAEDLKLTTVMNDDDFGITLDVPSEKVVVHTSVVSEADVEISSKKRCNLTRSEVFCVSIGQPTSESSPVWNKSSIFEPSFQWQETSVNGSFSSRITSDLADALECLIDATRCVRAETQLEEAEIVLDQLITKFAAPKDLCTAWDNLTTTLEDGEYLKAESDPCTVPVQPSAEYTFSPIFKLLLAQPESHIFPDLCKPTSSGRQLQELCNRLATAIRRTKRKLRVLQRMRIRQATNAIGPINTPKEVSAFSDQSGRRARFLNRIRSIWPGAQNHSSLLTILSEDNGNCEDTDPSRLTSTPVITPPRASPQIYTSPLECPLSLLSFVSNLNNAPLESSVNPGQERKLKDMPHSKSIVKSNNYPGELAIEINPNDSANLPKPPSTWPNLNSRPVLTNESPISPGFSFPCLSVSPSSCSTKSCDGKSTLHRGSFRGKRSRLGLWSGNHPESDNCPSKTKRSGNSCTTKDPTELRCTERRRLTCSPTEVSVFDASSNTSTRPSTNGKRSWRRRHVSSDYPPQSRSKNVPNDHAPRLNLPSPLEPNHLDNWAQLNVDTADVHSWLPDSHETDTRIETGLCNGVSTRSATSTSRICTSCKVSSGPTSPRSNFLRRRVDQESSYSFEHDDSGTFSSEEPFWTNNRPPTPDIRRSDLDVADLSEGTRILVIQDTHLRAGTLHFYDSPGTDDVTSGLPQRAKENPREQRFCIHLDSDRPSIFTSQGGSRGTQSLSPGRTASESQPRLHVSPFSPKKRRQTDLILYGWQVVQQAVLEVFPTSVRHLPPGTRVCAAWSEQLASNLYPGTVVETVCVEGHSDCVAVDFDDGDHRQVSIRNIRMLPDHFTNLYELAHAYGARDLVRDIMQPTFTSDVSQVCTESHKLRTRRHSAVDQCTAKSLELTEGKRKWNQSSRFGKMFHRLSSSIVGSKSNLTDRTETKSVLTTSPYVTCVQSSHSPVSPTTALVISSTAASNGLFSPSLSTHQSANDLLAVSSLDPIPKPPATVYLNVSPLADRDSTFDTVSTSTNSSDATSWHIVEKIRRRKQGHTYCKSIMRETDGLLISLGITVEFGSDQDEVYLGEVREIRWDEATNSPVVTAAWFYHPREAGSEGKLVSRIKGAVFATEHVDENEARCINRRAAIFPSYAKFRENHPDLPDDHSDIEHEDPTSKMQQRTNGANQSDDHGTEVDYTSDLNCSLEARSITSSINSDERVYFVTGKYDPVTKRVLSWDPDIAKIIGRNRRPSHHST